MKQTINDDDDDDDVKLMLNADRSRESGPKFTKDHKIIRPL